MYQPIYKNKLVVVAVTGIAAIGCASVYLFSSQSSASSNLPDDPRMKDTIFQNAIVIAGHLRNYPQCVSLGKLIIGYADPGRGPEAYREQVLNRMTEKISRSCFDEKATAAPPELVAYINSTNPSLQKNSVDTTSSSGGKNTATKTPSIVQIEPIVVVLADSEKAHYLQTAFSIQVNDRESAEKTKRAMPELKDRAIKYFGAKMSSDMSTVSGKEAMTKELIEKFNQPMSSIGGEVIDVRNIYFTAFAIQTE